MSFMGLFILPKLEEMEEIPIFRSKIKLYISSYLYMQILQQGML